MVGNGAGVLPFGNYGSADGAGSRGRRGGSVYRSNDGTTLTIQGDGEITSQALNANVTAEQKKDTHFCGDWRRRYRDCRWLQLGISRGCNQRYPEGIGGVPIWQVFFKGQKNLTVQSERTSLAIGSYAFTML